MRRRTVPLVRRILPFVGCPPMCIVSYLLEMGLLGTRTFLASSHSLATFYISPSSGQIKTSGKRNSSTESWCSVQIPNSHTQSTRQRRRQRGKMARKATQMKIRFMINSAWACVDMIIWDSPRTTHTEAVNFAGHCSRMHETGSHRPGCIVWVSHTLCVLTIGLCARFVFDVVEFWISVWTLCTPAFPSKSSCIAIQCHQIVSQWPGVAETGGCIISI